MALTTTSLYNLKDYLLDIDDLNKPKVLDMMEVSNNKMNSAILMIARLILMKKATYMDQPDMGIDIRGRYRFSFENELSDLNKDLQDQINKYLPEASPVTVNCYYQQINKQNCVIIQMSIQQSMYQLIYNTETYTLAGFENNIYTVY